MNYFELFDLPICPVADKQVLSKKYIQLQRQNHPDYHVGSNDIYQQDALDNSANINAAYKTLKDDQATLAYFLDIKGYLSEEYKYDLPQTFLMEMMDLNEELSFMTKQEASEMIEKHENQLLSTVVDILNQPAADYTEVQFQLLRDYYFKKKYLHRILDRLTD